MGMIEKAETEYAELSRKKEVILNDKAKIEAVIEELDVKKAQVRSRGRSRSRGGVGRQ